MHPVLAWLQQGYGITLRVVGYCMAAAEVENRADGYNNVMKPEIERRFGPDIWDRARAEFRHSR